MNKSFRKILFAVILLCAFLLAMTSCNRTFTSYIGGGEEDELVYGEDSYYDVSEEETYIIQHDGYTAVIKGYDENGDPIISYIFPGGEEVIIGNGDEAEEDKQPMEFYTLPDGTETDKNNVTVLEDGTVAVKYYFDDEMCYGHKVFMPSGQIWYTTYNKEEGDACVYGEAYHLWVDCYDTSNVLLQKQHYIEGGKQLLDSEEHIYEEWEQYDVKITYRSQIVEKYYDEEGNFSKTVTEFLPDFDHEKPVRETYYESDGTVGYYSDFEYKLDGVTRKLTYTGNGILESIMTVDADGLKSDVFYNEDGSVDEERYYNEQGWMERAVYYYNDGRSSLTYYDEDIKRLKSLLYYPDGSVETTLYENGYDKSASKVDANGNLLSTTVYVDSDQEGNEKVYVYNPQGVLIESYDYVVKDGVNVSSLYKVFYDDGKLSTLTEYSMDGVLLNYERYDRNGNRVE